MASLVRLVLLLICSGGLVAGRRLRQPRLLEDGTVVMPNGDRCPPATGACPTVVPTLETLDLRKAAGTQYTIERSFRPEMAHHECVRSRLTAAGEDEATGTVLVRDNNDDKVHSIPFGMIRPEPDEAPLRVRINMDQLPFPLYSTIVGGGTSEDGIVWSVSYNCTETMVEMEDDDGESMMMMMMTRPVTSIDLTASQVELPEALREQIRSEIASIGLDSCTMTAVAHDEECPVFD